jgi:hypothetical protein
METTECNPVWHQNASNYRSEGSFGISSEDFGNALLDMQAMLYRTGAFVTIADHRFDVRNIEPGRDCNSGVLMVFLYDVVPFPLPASTMWELIQYDQGYSSGSGSGEGCQSDRWPGVDSHPAGPQICDECSALINFNDEDKPEWIHTCNDYCISLGFFCEDANDDRGDRCRVRGSTADLFTCETRILDSAADADALCYCSQLPPSWNGAPTVAPTMVALPMGVLTCGSTVTGDTRGAQNNVGRSSGEHYYTFTVEALGGQRMRFSTCNGTQFDNRLRLYAGNHLEASGIELRNVDDACGLQAVIESMLAPGVYTLIVEGFSSNEGIYQLETTCYEPTWTPEPECLSIEGDNVVETCGGLSPCAALVRFGRSAAATVFTGDTGSVQINGERCPSSAVVVTGSWCIQGAPHYDQEGMVCANDNTATESYCSYEVGAAACAYCSGSGLSDGGSLTVDPDMNTCGQFCASRNLLCVDANDEKSNTCNVMKATADDFDCTTVIDATAGNDAICYCAGGRAPWDPIPTSSTQLPQTPPPTPPLGAQCNTGAWPAVKNDRVCDNLAECAALIDFGDAAVAQITTCGGYCASQGLACRTANDERNDQCRVLERSRNTIDCATAFGSDLGRDGICYCSGPSTAPASCDNARAACQDNNLGIAGVSESCYNAVVQAGIPQTQSACVGPFVPANVSVECQQAVDGALTACPGTLATTASTPSVPPELGCNPAAWPAVKNGNVCDNLAECTALIDFSNAEANGATNCADFCANQDLVCLGTHDEKRNNCRPRLSVETSCTTVIDSAFDSDAICYCGIAQPTLSIIPE